MPYLWAWVGYPGLLFVTLLFVWRFIAALEARVAEIRQEQATQQWPADTGAVLT